MPLPYTVQTLKEQSFFERLIGKNPPGNAFLELNNVLAESNKIQDVTVEKVCEIAEKYGINFNKKFSNALEGIYEDYLIFCLMDKTLSENEISDLAHLKHILQLKDEVIDKVHSSVAEKIYSESIDEAIKDSRIDPLEREFLVKLEMDLKIDEELARNIYTEKFTKYLNQTLDTMIVDQRLSEDEEKELESIAKSFGVELEFEEKTKRMLELYKLYWLIENGEIPTIDPGINLQRGEECYFMRDVEWHELRTITKGISYSGPMYSIKIFKGFYWRMGDLGVQRVTDDVFMHIDSGKLYLTNKRLIFQGTRKNTTINLSKILDFTPYKNGVDIQKDSGKSPFLKFDDGIDLFSMILARVIRDLG